MDTNSKSQSATCADTSIKACATALGTKVRDWHLVTDGSWAMGCICKEGCEDMKMWSHPGIADDDVLVHIPNITKDEVQQLINEAAQEVHYTTDLTIRQTFVM